MRYRKMDANDDYVFGQSSFFLVDTPEAVAQAIRTRLRLFTNEWFLDKREGVDLDNILGYGTHDTRDYEVQQRILGTQGVLSITAYSSSMDGRDFSVAATVDTIYGSINITEVIT